MTYFLVWAAVTSLALVFNYCSSHVSNGGDAVRDDAR